VSGGPPRFGDVLLVLVVLAHDSIVSRAGGQDQGVRKHEWELHLTGSQPHRHGVYLGKRDVSLIALTPCGIRAR
jgi:hypothetical protein